MPPGLVILLVAVALLIMFRRAPAVLVAIIATGFIAPQQFSPAVNSADRWRGGLS